MKPDTETITNTSPIKQSTLEYRSPKSQFRKDNKTNILSAVNTHNSPSYNDKKKNHKTDSNVG